MTAPVVLTRGSPLMSDSGWDLVSYYRDRCTQLEDENARLRAQQNELAEIAMRGALAADQAKLELILSGALSKPKTT